MISEYLLKKAGINIGKLSGMAKTLPGVGKYLSQPAKRVAGFPGKVLDRVYTGSWNPAQPPVSSDFMTPEMQAQLRQFIQQQRQAAKRMQLTAAGGASVLTGAATYGATQNKEQKQPADQKPVKQNNTTKETQQ